MISCQRCFGRSQIYLCANCTRELRDMLSGLAHGQQLPNGHRGASWIENLQDGVWGRTRLGESARRSTDRNSPLMVHLDASRLLDNVHATLVRWVQDMCDSRGIDYPAGRFYPRDFIGPLPVDGYRGHAGATRSAAIWLAKHVNAIACSEDAGMCYAEIKQVVDEVEKAINRPEPPRVCGPCDALLTDNYGQRVCGTELTVNRDEKEIQCPTCKTTHNVEQLGQRHVDNTNDKSFTIKQLHRVILPAGQEYIPLRTLQHWAASAKLVPTGYDSDGEPRFMLGDVRKLRDAKPQRLTTGAAARRKVG